MLFTLKKLSRSMQRNCIKVIISLLDNYSEERIIAYKAKKGFYKFDRLFHTPLNAKPFYIDTTYQVI